ARGTWPRPLPPAIDDAEASGSGSTRTMTSDRGRRPGLELSVVVPCYNEEAVLPELLRRLGPPCASVAGDAYEIVLVNDGSRDRTWALIKEMSEQDPHVVGLNLSRNRGHQLALTAGLTFCRGRRVLVIDADLQDPPELLPEMVALLDRGADVV